MVRIQGIRNRGINDDKPVNPFEVLQRLKERRLREIAKREQAKFNNLMRIAKKQDKNGEKGTFQQYRLQSRYGVDIDLGPYDSGENPGNRQ